MPTDIMESMGFYLYKLTSHFCHRTEMLLLHI
jgi:hypothetical protein